MTHRIDDTDSRVRVSADTDFISMSRAAQTIAQKALAGGPYSEKIDGHDVIAVRVAVDLAIHKARACDSPTLIEALTYPLAEAIVAAADAVPGDLQANTCFIIEDYATQVGQGGIRERGPEMLAQTDVKPILLRKIWLREIAAMLEGRAMKYWTIPIDPLTPITALIDVQC